MAGAQAEIDALLAEVEAQAQEAPAPLVATGAAPGPFAMGEDCGAVQSDGSPVPLKVQRILCLRVPLQVVLAERKMPVGEILHISVGSIIEFEKPFDEELEMYVNNRSISFGQAVKIGENFGMRVTRVADVTSRIRALTPAIAPGT